MSLVKTNDLKKGTRVLLSNGWYATLADNARGNTRMATVEGYHTETGSVYAHDIVEAQIADSWISITHTPQQDPASIAIGARIKITVGSLLFRARPRWLTFTRRTVTRSQ
jgi:hypothetical protein